MSPSKSLLVLCVITQSCPTLCGCDLPGSSVLGDSPGKDTEVGCHTLLQGIFPAQGLNPSFPHCRWIIYHLHHKGSPRIQSGLLIPTPGDLSDPGIELGCPTLQADSLSAELPENPKMKVKLARLCPTLCNCILHGILQARILEWAAIPFSRGYSKPKDPTPVSHTGDRFFTS